jgi:histidinol-phosphate aminotransferase
LKLAIKSIAYEREKLFKELTRINGVYPYPSEANFILFRVKRPDRIYRGLMQRGVLIRNIDNIIRGCLRVTIGTPNENRKFLNSLKRVLKV